MADPKMNNQTQGYSNKQTVKEPVGNQVPGWSPSNSYYKNDNDYYRRRYQDRGSYPAIRRQDGSYIDPDKDFQQYNNHYKNHYFQLLQGALQEKDPQRRRNMLTDAYDIGNNVIVGHHDNEYLEAAGHGFFNSLMFGVPGWFSNAAEKQVGRATQREFHRNFYRMLQQGMDPQQAFKAADELAANKADRLNRTRKYTGYATDAAMILGTAGAGAAVKGGAKATASVAGRLLPAAAKGGVTAARTAGTGARTGSTLAREVWQAAKPYVGMSPKAFIRAIPSAKRWHLGGNVFADVNDSIGGPQWMSTVSRYGANIMGASPLFVAGPPILNGIAAIGTVTPHAIDLGSRAISKYFGSGDYFNARATQENYRDTASQYTPQEWTGQFRAGLQQLGRKGTFQQWSDHLSRGYVDPTFWSQEFKDFTADQQMQMFNTYAKARTILAPQNERFGLVRNYMFKDTNDPNFMNQQLDKLMQTDPQFRNAVKFAIPSMISGTDGKTSSNGLRFMDTIVNRLSPEERTQLVQTTVDGMDPKQLMSLVGTLNKAEDNRSLGPGLRQMQTTAIDGVIAKVQKDPKFGYALFPLVSQAMQENRGGFQLSNAQINRVLTVLADPEYASKASFDQIYYATCAVLGTGAGQQALASLGEEGQALAQKAIQCQKNALYQKGIKDPSKWHLMASLWFKARGSQTLSKWAQDPMLFYGGIGVLLLGGTALISSLFQDDQDQEEDDDSGFSKQRKRKQPIELNLDTSSWQ